MSVPMPILDRMTRQDIADDIFAGAGGWDLAARMLGIRARGVEKMKEARATRAAAGLETIHDDVWTFVPDGLANGLIASPPCPTFSQAGKGGGRKVMDDIVALIRRIPFMSLADLRAAAVDLGDDELTALVLTPVWFLIHHDHYRWTAWEQVPTVLPVWEACAVLLRHSGWHVWTGKLSSEQYGDPQTRTRAVLIGSRDYRVLPPMRTHSRYYPTDPQRVDPGMPRWISLSEALGWDDGGHGTDCTCEVTFTATNPRPNAAHRTPCQPAPTMAFGHEQPRWNPRETTPDGRPRFAQQSDNDPDYGWPDNRPATVVAGRDLVQAPGATANRFNNSTKSRNDGVRVSVAEAGVLQSFPADHPWQGGKSAQYLQAGNAVPVLLARATLAAATNRPAELTTAPVDAEDPQTTLW